MRNLLRYIEEANRFRSLFDEKEYSLPLSQDDINNIADDIDCRLSPENLCCDGEISVSEANRKFNYLHRVFSDLKAHAKSQGLDITVETYEIT